MRHHQRIRISRPRHAAIPVLELKFDRAKGTVAYKWCAEEAGFAMPIKMGERDHLTLVALLVQR